MRAFPLNVLEKLYFCSPSHRGTFVIKFSQHTLSPFLANLRCNVILKLETIYVKRSIRMRQLFLLIGLSIILSACGGYPIETTMSEEVPEFEFVNQEGESFGLKDLEGEWWIADFIFTNCTTVCLPMTANMAKLQEMMKEEGIDAQLVSFSVDPDFDTPEILKAYGESYKADFSNWNFLTGYDFDTIKELSIKTFKSILAEPPEGTNQVTHGTSFFLVSPEGEVIKSYNGAISDNMKSIISDLKKVQ